MKNLSPAFQAHLDSGATTLAWCWKLTRRDATVFGFTDHDRDLSIDGVVFESSAGFTASEIKDGLGLAIDNLDVAAALSSARLNENDLASGLYDDAAVEIWRVNWQDTAQRVLMRAGSLGEVRRSGAAFSAEVRGLAHYLNQPQGRLYQYTCDATLGDDHCGVDLSTPANTSIATITAVLDARRITVSGLASRATDWCSRGLATFTSGINTGLDAEIRRHSATSTTSSIELWQQLPRTPAVGDTLIVSAGCDKHAATCRSKFDNLVNFRGFPHLPGNNLLTTPAQSGDGHDGLALRGISI
jgi:uncharacterized phage protein (TIGR02218 family)